MLRPSVEASVPDISDQGRLNASQVTNARTFGGTIAAVISH